jgi:hypothetical protein
MKTVVVSFYMDTMPVEMVRAQAEVISRFLPLDWAFHQINTAYSHAESVDNFLAATRYKTVVLLDIDCIPLHRAAFGLLADDVSSTQIVGCAQRANHIPNDGHLYAGPFCCAFDRDLFEAVGRPSFAATPRGDCGEELTYACEEHGKVVRLWWPSAVETPRWKLTDEISFGIGTEYEGRFWHLFESRFDHNRDRFLAKCHETIEADIRSHSYRLEDTRRAIHSS